MKTLALVLGVVGIPLLAGSVLAFLTGSDLQGARVGIVVGGVLSAPLLYLSGKDQR